MVNDAAVHMKRTSPLPFLLGVSYSGIAGVYGRSGARVLRDRPGFVFPPAVHGGSSVSTSSPRLGAAVTATTAILVGGEVSHRGLGLHPQ